MMDWLVTALVLMIGFTILVLGWLPYVFISFMVFLGICVLSEFTLHFINVFGDKDK